MLIFRFLYFHLGFLTPLCEFLSYNHSLISVDLCEIWLGTWKKSRVSCPETPVSSVIQCLQHQNSKGAFAVAQAWVKSLKFLSRREFNRLFLSACFPCSYPDSPRSPGEAGGVAEAGTQKNFRWPAQWAWWVLKEKECERSKAAWGGWKPKVPGACATVWFGVGAHARSRLSDFKELKTAHGFSFTVTATWSLQTETVREKEMIAHLSKQPALCPQVVWTCTAPSTAPCCYKASIPDRLLLTNTAFSYFTFHILRLKDLEKLLWRFWFVNTISKTCPQDKRRKLSFLQLKCQCMNNRKMCSKSILEEVGKCNSTEN